MYVPTAKGRIGEWWTHRCWNLVQTTSKEDSAEDSKRMCARVDLHKKQFTVYWRTEGKVDRECGRHTTHEADHRQFEQ